MLLLQLPLLLLLLLRLLAMLQHLLHLNALQQLLNLYCLRTLCFSLWGPPLPALLGSDPVRGEGRLLQQQQQQQRVLHLLLLLLLLPWGVLVLLLHLVSQKRLTSSPGCH